MIEDNLWEAAEDAASQRGTTVLAVIREALTRFVHDVNCGCNGGDDG